MLRLSKQGTNTWYGIEIENIEDDLENIELFVEEGSPVLLCEDIDQAIDDLGIDKLDIIIVDRRED